MLIGYARVSTGAQDLESQRATLTAAGCERIYEEKVSGARRDRPELARMLEHLREGDVVVVARLDRLARSTRDLLDIAHTLGERRAELRSLSEEWANTTSASGRMILTVLAGIADFERELILQRTGEGRKAAQARGVKFGRPAKVTEDAWTHYREQIRSGSLTAVQAANLMGVDRSTVFRMLAKSEEVGA